MYFQEAIRSSNQEVTWHSKKDGKDMWVTEGDHTNDKFYYEIEKDGVIVYDSREHGGWFDTRAKAETAAIEWVNQHPQSTTE